MSNRSSGWWSSAPPVVVEVHDLARVLAGRVVSVVVVVLVGPGRRALQPFPAGDPVPGGLRDEDGGADQVRGAAGDVVGGAAGEPAPPQELVHGAFLVARHPGGVLVGVGAGVDPF